MSAPKGLPLVHLQRNRLVVQRMPPIVLMTLVSSPLTLMAVSQRFTIVISMLLIM